VAVQGVGDLQFGIDLGTTHSLIAVLQDGVPELIPNALGQVLTPSVVALRGGEVVVGEAARQIARARPDQAAALFKRGMGTDRTYALGRQTYGAVELSALVLAGLKADAEAHLGVAVSDVVISVPAYFNEMQRKAVRAAGRMAGLEVQRLINEPTAAALAYGLQDRAGEARFLVFDLGGGTFDVSILEQFEGVMEVRATAGDAFLGGEDFTDHLARYLATQAGFDPHDPAMRPGFLTLAEQAKRALSQEAQVQVKAPVAGVEIDVTVTRDRFDEVTAGLMARLTAPLERALRDAKMAPGDLDRVLLVGGATRMPQVRAYLTRALKQFPVMGIDPDHVVALGAAVMAGLVARDQALDDVVMTDVAAFTLGVETAMILDGKPRDGYFAPVIERNSIVPISRVSRFQTTQLGQTRIELGIYQGESPLVANNLALGKLGVAVPKNLLEHEEVEVRFTYDVSGLLEVELTAVSTGRSAQVTITRLAGEMSAAEMEAATARVARAKVPLRAEAENLALLARIEAAFAMARGEARDWAQALLVQFETALEAQDRGALGALRSQIHAALDAFEAGHVR
jgi:molecular chaperone HscC